MSGVTVKEILTLAAMTGAQVIGGADGLSRIVTGVNVMEVPDIEAYVKPGEILLTTGFPVHDRPERLVELVPELAERGLAALAIKPLRYLATLPDALVEAADLHRLPLIVMPDHTSFNDVIGAVLAVVLADYGAEPASAEAIRERLTGVALSGGGLDGIAAALAAAIDRRVRILDSEGFALGTSQDPSRPTAADVVVDDDDDDDDRPWTFPVTVGGLERGAVVVSGSSEPTLGQRRLIRQSCFAAAMHIAQALAGLELDRKLRTLFLEELVTGVIADEQVIRQRSRLYGWDLGGDHRVVVARCRKELPDAAIAVAARRSLPPGTLAWSRGTEVVAIVPMPETAGRQSNRRYPHAVWDTWQQALLDLHAEEAVVAVGSLAATALMLADSHGAAREAVRIALAADRTVVRYDDLMLERLLLANSREFLAGFAERQVGALVRHDGATGADLCGTLEVFLGYGNGAEAARRLFIHYNTLKHRLRRIAELTGADLHDPRTRLTLALAIEARKLASGGAR